MSSILRFGQGSSSQEPSTTLTMQSRTRNVSPSGGYTLLPNSTPSHSPPFGPTDPERLGLRATPPPLAYVPQTRRRSAILASLVAILIAAISVILSRALWPRFIEPTYFQWLSGKMASDDPFDELGLARGVGPVERSMWGMHEERGWDRGAYMFEKGLKELKNGELYRLRYNTTTESVKEYFEELRETIHAFPLPMHSDLLNSFHSHLPKHLSRDFSPLTPRRQGPAGMINYKTIYQTDINPPQEGSAEYQHQAMWRNYNEVDGWELLFMNDTDGDRWVRERFEEGKIMDTWAELHRGVLKADFLRYLLILMRGGVYSDIDTRPLRPIEHWGANSVEYLDISLTDGPDYVSKLSAHPAVIVGVEIDVPSDKYTWYWPRPVQICQWTLSGAPYHPIYLDTVRRVMNATQVVNNTGIDSDAPGEDRRREDIVSILEWTGPPMFSDSVMQYLLSRYRVSWHRLRGIRHPVRIGEVLVLPNTAFAPGTHAAGDVYHRQANVQHQFRGSWKTRNDVF